MLDSPPEPDDEENKIRALQQKYRELVHAMQSGVKLDLMLRDKGQDNLNKHLRVGINVAMSDHAALTRILVSRGIISELEYHQALVDAMEAEVKSYEEKHGVKFA